jgi:hypothetical protein
LRQVKLTLTVRTSIRDRRARLEEPNTLTTLMTLHRGKRVLIFPNCLLELGEKHVEYFSLTLYE